jgi:hypothetical protein
MRWGGVGENAATTTSPLYDISVMISGNYSFDMFGSFMNALMTSQMRLHTTPPVSVKNIDNTRPSPIALGSVPPVIKIYMALPKKHAIKKITNTTLTILI